MRDSSTLCRRKLAFLGIESSPAFVRAPEGNGCAERFIRTLKENLLWVRPFDTVEELRQALLGFREIYNTIWLIERHGFRHPQPWGTPVFTCGHGRVASIRCLTNWGRYKHLVGGDLKSLKAAEITVLVPPKEMKHVPYVFELRAYRLPEEPLGAEARAAEHRLVHHRIRGGIAEAEPGLVLQAGDVIAISGRGRSSSTWSDRAGKIEDKELLDVRLGRRGDADEPENRRPDSRRGVGAGLDAGPVSSIAHPRRPGNPDRAWRRFAARRLAACGRAGAGCADIGLAHRRHRCSQLNDRFCCAGTRHFPWWCCWCPSRSRLAGSRSRSAPALVHCWPGFWWAICALVIRCSARFDGAIALMTSLGLAAFVGLTGIHAGPIFLSALKEAGIGLLLGGMVVTLAPQIVGLALGHFVLRNIPILLLGALAGAQTVTAAMAALQERSGSPVPASWGIRQRIRRRTSC